MRYTLLGSSGLRVSEVALGTMTFGEAWGWGASEDECRSMFDAFVEAGGNFVDTASNYTDGQSEEIVGSLTAADRERFVVATKYTLTSRREDPNAGGNHRKNLVRALETSLRRLRTDYVDLLQCHRFDPGTPASIFPAVAGPTTSTSSGCTCGTALRRWRKSCGRSTISCRPGRCSTSASRTLPRGSSRAR